MLNTDFDWQIDEFMVYCRSTQLREKTMASYEQTLRLFERWCKEQLNIVDVDKVTEAVIRRYIHCSFLYCINPLRNEVHAICMNDQVFRVFKCISPDQSVYCEVNKYRISVEKDRVIDFLFPLYNPIDNTVNQTIHKKLQIVIVAIRTACSVFPNYLALGFLRGRTIAPSGSMLYLKTIIHIIKNPYTDSITLANMMKRQNRFFWILI